jgi:hypothetical protein
MIQSEATVMAKFSEIEMELLKSVTDDRERSSLARLREAAEDIWSNDAPRIIKGYTNHGIEHSERLAGFAYHLLSTNIGKGLSTQEIYLLLASIYLHDIGMQCDVVKHTKIKIRAEEIKKKAESKQDAHFGIIFTSQSANDYNPKEQNEIRANHHYLSAAWIDYAYRTGETVLGPAVKSISSDLISDLMDICMYHTKLPISHCPLPFLINRTERKQFVAALLRFADELDIDGRRVSLETVKNFALNPHNSLYWWLHHRTKVLFSPPNMYTIIIWLHPLDHEKYGSYIHTEFITEFQTKNAPVLTILAQNGISIVPNSIESKVIADEYAEPLPTEILLALEEMQKKHNPLSDLANEVRTWLRVMRYEVSSLDQNNRRVIDMQATLDQRSLKQRILVRCIDGEIGHEEVENLDAILGRNTQGWLISDSRVTNRAYKKASEVGDDIIQVFNLSDFLQQKVWGPYIDTLKGMVENDRIPQLYVSQGCYKREIDEDEKATAQDEYPILESYMDGWLKERGRTQIAILGDFGAGKTWFCRYYAYRQMKSYLEDPAHKRLPLLITLRAFTKEMDAQQLINYALLEQYKLPFVGSAFDIFQNMNRQGKLLLILDGFDEMARQVDMQTMVDNFWVLADLVDENSKVILTCRTEYFRKAREAEEVLSGKIIGRNTQGMKSAEFELLFVKPFNDDQIREVISRRLGEDQGPKVANRILNAPNKNLAEMARKPVLIELLLAALDEAKADLLKKPAHVYLYATNRLLLRNITAQKTFTSTADKLYFLCELAWEMIRTGNLRIHYKSIPERIKSYFGDRIKDQHELDVWESDLRSQTLLHNNAGYFEFAHKSLAEYFVAFRFALELGCLALAFKQTYREADNQYCKLPFKDKEIIDLAETFGETALINQSMNAVCEFLQEMVTKVSTRRLKHIIDETRGKSLDQVGYVGGNAATLLRLKGYSFEGADLADTVLAGADLRVCQLTTTNLHGCDLSEADLRGSRFTAQALESAKFKNIRVVCAYIFNIKKKGGPTQRYRDPVLDMILPRQTKWISFLRVNRGRYLHINEETTVGFLSLNINSLVDWDSTKDSLFKMGLVEYIALYDDEMNKIEEKIPAKERIRLREILSHI